MEDKDKIVWGVVLGAGALVIGVNWMTAIREGREERKAIRAEAQKDLEAIRIAHDRVVERLRSESPVPSIDTLMNQFKFEMIVAREEQ